MLLFSPKNALAVTNLARLSYTEGSSYTFTDSGYVGDTKTIYLTNAVTATTYTLYWTTTNVTSGGGTSLGTITVPALETSGSCNITIPAAAKGTYYMHVESLVDNSDPIYTLSFTLSPKLTSVSSSSGYVGDTVTVSGTGFAQETVTVKFGSYTFGTYAVGSNGNLSLTTTVPDMPYGLKTITAEGTLSGTIIYLALTFSVNPKISLSANSGVYNTTITVSGTGFDANSTITITWDGTDTATTTLSNNLGSFSTNYTPPNSDGAHTIAAHDTANHTASGLTYVVINPSITISASTGKVGDSITVDGTAFKPSSTITITWNGVDTATTTTSSSTGTFSKAFTIPEAVYGNYTIGAHDADNNSAPTKTFSITPKITISSSSGPVGTQITVSGTGFDGSSTITLTWDGADTSTTTSSNASGSFSSLSYTIPTTTGGTHNINAHDSAAHTASNIVFTITPTISISSTSGYAGDTTTLSGDGFAGSSTITVVWKGADTTTTTTSAANGTFSGLVYTIPLTETAGTYTITARDTIPTAAPNKNYTVVLATTPVITLSSNEGPSGSIITISGNNFSVIATTATIRWDGANTATTCALSGGSFSNCAFTIPSATIADHNISAKDDAAIPNTSADQVYTVIAATATKLGMKTQPGGGTAATVWAQQPEVYIQDANGNTVTTDSSTQVTAAIGTNPPGDGTLSGTTTVTAVSGVVTFTDLKIDKAGTGYTLTFTSSPVLTSVTSSTFNITAAGSLTVTGVTYQQALRKLAITFNNTVDINTFTSQNLGNLSIQDGTTTVNLTGAAIITTASSTIMEASLTVAEDNALLAIKDNALRLVVGASCGIKDLSANELAQNTYATSTYSVTYTAASATSITGTIKDSKSSLIIANATIKLYDSAGNLRAETTSDTSGNFSFNVNIPSGDYTLSITKPPFCKDKDEVTTITAGTADDVGDVLIDPYGIVYDSVTDEVIAGANVTLYTASGNIYTGSPQPNPQSSRSDGGYNFDVAPGTYYLTATKDGYSSYTGATFTVTTDIVQWNIPMVPDNQASSTYLSIFKQANKKVVTAGDIITYAINIKNLSSTLSATSVTVADTLPHGFKYISGSTLVDGQKAADPSGTRSLSWSLGTLATQASKKITYRVRVGPDAKIGKNENSARVSATVGGGATSAGPSIAAVEIREGLFSDRGMLMGKVFEDKNGNGVQDKNEPGIPNVSLILEDGTVIVTDEFGRYFVPNVKKGTHVIRLDQRVLPDGPFSKTKLPAPEKPKCEPLRTEELNEKQTREKVIDNASTEIVSSRKPASEREAIIDWRHQLDTWRKEVGTLFNKVLGVLGLNKTQIKKEEGQTSSATVLSSPEKSEEKIPDREEKKEESSVQQKEAINQPSSQGPVEREAIIDRRQLDTWRKEALQTKEGQAQDKEGAKSKEKAKDVAKRTPRSELLNKYGGPSEPEGKPRGGYRPDIPKESKFFKIFGSETSKVNFPVKLLSEEEAKKEAEKDKRPNQFMLVGLADGTIGYLNAKGNISNLESSQNAPYEESFYKDGSVKLYLKGLVKGEYLLTASLDTDKEKDRRHLFEYVNPEKYYPIYGDNSSYFNETDTRGKFYARIDKDDSYGLWGNYNTQEFTKNEFTRYNRTLAGAKTHIELKDWAKEKDKIPVKPSIDFFYAPSTQEQVSETFSAKGISGPFWLGKTPLLEYAESIRIETRDKDRSGVILHTKTLARDLDYEIDYDSGRILFKEPISTRDENDDPNFIVVDYEYVPLSGENKYYLTGSRLQAKMFGDKITLGGQIIAENHISNNPRLFGADIVFQPDSTTRLSAEWGYSKNYLDTNNAIIKEDNAWKVEGSKNIGKLKLQGYYSDIGNRFRNPVNVTEKGREKYGATADYQFTDATSLVLDHWRNLSTISKTFDRQTSLDFYHKKENYFLSAGYAFQEYKDTQHLTPNKDTWLASLKGGLKIFKNLIASLEQEFKNELQSKTANPIDNKISTTTGRLDYKLSEDAIVYAKNRFVKELHKKYQNIQSIGFTRKTADGDAYVEYGFGGQTAETTFGLKKEQNLNERLTLSSYMNNRVSADKNEENIGFGTKYEVREGLFTTFNFENTSAKNSDASYYKQNSQSIAFDYLPYGTENSYGVKFERRKATSSRELNFFGYVKHYLNKAFSFLFNSEYLSERSGKDTIRTNRKSVVGLAYRPIYNDKLNLLGKYEYKDELNHTTSSLSTDYYAHIVSLEADYELTSKLDLFGKYALKFQKEKDNDLDTDTLIDMITTKLTYKFTSTFDLTGYYRIINDRGSRVIKQAPALEAGILFFKQFRLGLGYNFLDYQDRDSSTEDYSGGGPYINFSAKF